MAPANNRKETPPSIGNSGYGPGPFGLGYGGFFPLEYITVLNRKNKTQK